MPEYCHRNEEKKAVPIDGAASFFARFAAVIIGADGRRVPISKPILIVDDDRSILKVIKLYLTKNGYEADEAYDGRTALHKIHSGSYLLVVLDLMLPQLDGWSVCRKMRELNDPTPIIMLTARGEVQERIDGLRLGADDYLVKPFDPNELLARIDTVLRRTASHPAPARSKSISIGNLTLNEESYTASIYEVPVSLTRKEFELLAFLGSRPGKVFSREDLIAQVWGWDYDGDDRVVDLYIQRIRRKLGAGEGWNLTTVWGVGYKFEVDA